jgi:hypothetical protein
MTAFEFLVVLIALMILDAWVVMVELLLLMLFVIGNVVFTQSKQISRLAFHDTSIGAGDDSSMKLATRSVNITVIAMLSPTSTPPPPPPPPPPTPPHLHTIPLFLRYLSFLGLIATTTFASAHPVPS